MKKGVNANYGVTLIVRQFPSTYHHGRLNQTELAIVLVSVQWDLASQFDQSDMYCTSITYLYLVIRKRKQERGFVSKL